MNKVKCPNFNRCEAPLCPEDERSLKHGLWYGNEEVCPVIKYRKLKWLQKQRKIARLGKGLDDGFFTVKMLDTLGIMRKGIQGANPDAVRAVETWLEKRALSVSK